MASIDEPASGSVASIIERGVGGRLSFFAGQSYRRSVSFLSGLRQRAFSLVRLNAKAGRVSGGSLVIDQFVVLCFRKRLVVRLIAILAAIFGIYAWTQLAIDAYPLLSPVSAQVTVQIPGLAAEEIEQQVTIPLERALNGTPGLVNMRSISTFALSQINLLFRDGAEDYWQRQRVNERIAGVTLPAGA